MDYIEINRQAWNKRTEVHIDSKFYDVEKFLKGTCSLNPIELIEVGNVKGKSLLHLQCHFGQDTLSWARLGASVTGVDLSSKAIEHAKKLTIQTGLKAEFINQDVYAFGIKNKQKFDVVYTSYGVLCWLNDLELWAKTVFDSLKVGGQFNLVEFHPFNDLLAGYSYFNNKQPDIEYEGTYTENCTGEKSTVVTWPHTMSDVIQALIKAGITIESFKEHVYSPYDCFEGLELVAGHGYQMRFKEQQIPLIYSIKGKKIAL